MNGDTVFPLSFPKLPALVKALNVKLAENRWLPWMAKAAATDDHGWVYWALNNVSPHAVLIIFPAFSYLTLTTTPRGGDYFPH